MHSKPYKTASSLNDGINTLVVFACKQTWVEKKHSILGCALDLKSANYL